MRHFLIKVLLYLTPFILLFGLTEWYLNSTGETIPINKVMGIQDHDRGVRFIRGYVSLDMHIYKWENIKRRSPVILVLGSSRVMQFRDYHFKPYEEQMYNAGGILQSAHDVIQLGEIFNEGLLPKPELLVIGLDPWWFKQQTAPKSTWLEQEELVDQATRYTSRLNVVQDLFRSGFKNFHYKFRYKRNIGALAQFNNSGFRYDGSMALSNTILEDFKLDPRYKDRGNVGRHIINGTTKRFTPSAPDTTLMQEVYFTLDQLQQAGMRVIIYFPPFASQSLELLTTDEKHEEWWTFYQEYMAELFKAGFDHVIPLESPEDYLLPDSFFEDGIHPSEVFVGIQWQRYVSRWKLKEFSFDVHYLDSINNAYVLPLSYTKTNE